MSSTFEHEPLIHIDTINHNGELARVEVDYEWGVKLGESHISCSPEAALCLSALMRRPDEVISEERHKKEMIDFHAQAFSQGAKQNPLVMEHEDDTVVRIQKNDRKVALSEFARGPLSPHIFRFGTRDSKHILLCLNILDPDYGLGIIDAYFEHNSSSNAVRARYFKDFLTRFNQFQPLAQSAPHATIPEQKDFPPATLKQEDTTSNAGRNDAVQQRPTHSAPIVETKSRSKTAKKKKSAEKQQSFSDLPKIDVSVYANNLYQYIDQLPANTELTEEIVQEWLKERSICPVEDDYRKVLDVAVGTELLRREVRPPAKKSQPLEIVFVRND